MSNAPQATQQPGSIWYFFLFFCAYLILRFLSGLFIPGGEWPLSPAHYLSMAIDLGLLAGVFGARSQLFAKLPEMDTRRPIAGILFVAAVISGVGLLLIRFTSDQAWWTGHLQDGL